MNQGVKRLQFLVGQQHVPNLGVNEAKADVNFTSPLRRPQGTPVDRWSESPREQPFRRRCFKGPNPKCSALRLDGPGSATLRPLDLPRGKRCLSGSQLPSVRKPATPAQSYWKSRSRGCDHRRIPVRHSQMTGLHLPQTIGSKSWPPISFPLRLRLNRLNLFKIKQLTPDRSTLENPMCQPAIMPGNVHGTLESGSKLDSERLRSTPEADVAVPYTWGTGSEKIYVTSSKETGSMHPVGAISASATSGASGHLTI